MRCTFKGHGWAYIFTRTVRMLMRQGFYYKGCMCNEGNQYHMEFGYLLYGLPNVSLDDVATAAEYMTLSRCVFSFFVVCCMLCW
jgi:hypothetical protein